jgi:hypothetical protein
MPDSWQESLMHSLIPLFPGFLVLGIFWIRHIIPWLIKSGPGILKRRTRSREIRLIMGEVSRPYLQHGTAAEMQRLSDTIIKRDKLLRETAAHALIHPVEGHPSPNEMPNGH